MQDAASADLSSKSGSLLNSVPVQGLEPVSSIIASTPDTILVTDISMLVQVQNCQWDRSVACISEHRSGRCVGSTRSEIGTVIGRIFRFICASVVRGHED